MYDNSLISDDPAAPVADVQGPTGVIAQNVVRPPAEEPAAGNSVR